MNKMMILGILSILSASSALADEYYFMRFTADRLCGVHTSSESKSVHAFRSQTGVEPREFDSSYDWSVRPSKKDPSQYNFSIGLAGFNPANWAKAKRLNFDYSCS